MAGKVMRAVQYDCYGGGVAGLKHVEIPVPTPGKGELLLKLEATTINPIEWKIQKGMLRPFLPKKFPYIPACDVSGEVVEIGAGVTKFKAGDKVISALPLAKAGGLAEYAVAKADITVIRPPSISAAEAAGLPGAAITALGALTQGAGLKLDGSGPCKNILITAASGGVGHFAVQIAKACNAHVTATCGARNADLLRSLGADEVLDYKTPEGAALKSPSGKKYDAVLQCAPPMPWSVFAPNLSSNGKVLDLSPGMSAMWTFAVKKVTLSKKQLVPFFATINGEYLQQVADLVKQGKLKTVIDCRFPLSEAGAAWAKSIEGHATGKIVVEQ